MLYEGTAKSEQVAPIWLTQEDEEVFLLRSVTSHDLGTRCIVEIFGCMMNGTGGCGQTFVWWQPEGRSAEIGKNLRTEFEALLPNGLQESEISTGGS